MDECPPVEVPDVYPWPSILVEENWHPAIHREDGCWYGPRLHPGTKVPNQGNRVILFPKTLPRGKSATNKYPILSPMIHAYLDALIYHKKHYGKTKPGLTFISVMAN
ncbi:uncharacterized protein EI97DRAFT_473985 [Westerdykella ornata]|uniref:Uncharacterized protein n=1 Tax=Westerdykella ornata TaxID=318751 RepID=A0A6A6JIQ3_WESOR|nr:uncharacterized protein EI97DRAFT_473985 [Westerdykella ornata]KAF2276104.1 hypothetical protein EI97DRAFT_473985 [Westerdykella ornata]